MTSDLAVASAGTVEQTDVARTSLSGFDAAALVVAAAMMLFCTPGGWSPFLTPRIAVLIGLIPVGLVLLVRMAVRRDIAAALACGLIAWAVVSALASDAPGATILGSIDGNQSVVILTGALSAWALGRQTSTRTNDLVGWTVVAAGAISGLVGLMQVELSLQSGTLGLIDDRPGGLAGHPVYFGAHMAACAAWFAYRVARRPGQWIDVVGFGAFAFFACLSGSRVALLATLLIAIAACCTNRAWRTLTLLPALLVAGVAATVVTETADLGRSAGQRVATGEGMHDRVDVWRFGLDAWKERPIAGWGLGRFWTATQPFYTGAWPARQGWTDGHNIFIDVLVAVGIVGLVLAIAFGVAACLGARGPLMWMTGAIALGWLVEPTMPATVGLAALLVGMSGPRLVRSRSATPRALVLAPAVAVGVLFGLWALVADLTLQDTVNHAASENLSGVSAWYRFDPTAAAIMSVAASYDVNATQADLLASRRWDQRAVDLDPENPTWRARVALRELQLEHLDAARARAQEALAIQPNNVIALQVLQTVAERTGDERLNDDVTERLCSIDAGVCPGPSDGS